MQHAVKTLRAAAGRRGLGRISVLITVLASLVLIAIPQAAGAESGRQRFHVTYAGAFNPADPPERTITAVGPIKGKGYENFIGVAPGPAPGTGVGTAEWIFPEGSVFVTITFTVDSRFNEHSCTSLQRMSGEWVITRGAGAYTGATGEGTFRGHNLVRGDKTPEGCAPQPDTLVSNFRFVGASTVPNT